MRLQATKRVYLLPISVILGTEIILNAFEVISKVIHDARHEESWFGFFSFILNMPISILLEKTIGFLHDHIPYLSTSHTWANLTLRFLVYTILATLFWAVIVHLFIWLYQFLQAKRHKRQELE